MRKYICMIIATGIFCSCTAVPNTTTPTDDPTPNVPKVDEVCQSAGTSEDQINSLRTLIENARDAGAIESDVLSDASAACELCQDPDANCDATLCEACFTAIVSEAFSELN